MGDQLVPVSPDCRDGNHHKCDGEAWDMEADAAVPCRCRYCHGNAEAIAEVAEAPELETCWGEMPCGDCQRCRDLAAAAARLRELPEYQFTVPLGMFPAGSPLTLFGRPVGTISGRTATVTDPVAIRMLRGGRTMEFSTELGWEPVVKARPEYEQVGAADVDWAPHDRAVEQLIRRAQVPTYPEGTYPPCSTCLGSLPLRALPGCKDPMAHTLTYQEARWGDEDPMRRPASSCSTCDGGGCGDCA